MLRNAIHNMSEWLAKPGRKPMVIRGARQVGKTWLVREVAKQHGLQLIELNFELEPGYKSLFNSNEPAKTLKNIASAFKVDVVPEKSLLFLDEIQAAPALLPKLRWFAEMCPELAVVAAGSLLEFVLNEHEMSMPVGRIQYYYLEPLTFEEFLQASDEQQLLSYIQDYQYPDEIPQILHQQLLEQVKEYLIIGGMPAAVAAWRETQSYREVHEIHHNLITSYRDDFPKYAAKTTVEQLNETLTSIPKLLTEKVKYSRINRNVPTNLVKNSINLLSRARLCHPIYATNASGVPLAASINEKLFKLILLDCGIVTTILDVNIQSLHESECLNINSHGGLTEQFVGQALRALNPYYVDPKLFYWVREEKGASAEVDYVLQWHKHIIPIEVKAGKTGRLKSLHYYVSVKNPPIALRFYAGYPISTEVKAQLYDGKDVRYPLLSLPYYLIGQLPRIIDEALARTHAS